MCALEIDKDVRFCFLALSDTLGGKFASCWRNEDANWIEKCAKKNITNFHKFDSMIFKKIYGGLLIVCTFRPSIWGGGLITKKRDLELRDSQNPDRLTRYRFAFSVPAFACQNAFPSPLELWACIAPQA